MSIFDLFNKEPRDVAFWNWFQKNEARLFDLEKEQDRIFVELARAMGKYHQGLTFEFGPKIDGVRDFVISGEGIKDRFPFVVALADAAPPLPRWKIIKFRPRRESFQQLTYEGVTVSIDDIKFSIEPDGEKPGITLYFDHFEESQPRAYMGLKFLYLDNCLGEFDVATKVGFIEAKPASDPSQLTRLPLTELATTFDRFVSIRSN